MSTKYSTCIIMNKIITSAIVIRAQIEWTKDNKEIRKSRKYKISRKGALKIIDIGSSDSGVYACIGKRSVSPAMPHILSVFRHVAMKNELIIFFSSGKFARRDAVDSEISLQRADK